MKEPLEDIVFITKPIEKDLQDIKSWCEDYNYSNAESAFKRNNLFVIHYLDKAIAFLCYRREKIVATIDFAEVQSIFRNMQVGGYMLESTLKHFKQTRIKIAELYCTSIKSHRHAKRHGFIPIKKAHDDKKWMFRPLVETRKPRKNSKVLFAIWKNTMGSYDQKPDVSWALDQDLEHPIIAYCYGDWTVGIIDNGNVVKETVFKRFFKGIEYDYVYIVGNKINE